MMQYPKVSVVIPVHNCAANLKETLTMLKEQDYKGELEIIVIDNNSKDSSEQTAQTFSGVILVYQKEIQNAAATRNKGIETATGEIIAFIDGDCIPEKDWIKQAVYEMEKDKIDRIGGRIGVKPISQNSTVTELLDTLYSFDQKGLVNSHQAAMTRNLIMRKEVFSEIGFFDDVFFEMEDIELGLRATKANIPIKYVHQCLVWHSPITKNSELFKKARRNGKGTFILCEKNPQWSGMFGWKHPFRSVKILVTPRTPYWDILDFEPKNISYLKRFRIYVGSWIIINIGEAYGYFEAWIKFILQRKFS